MEGFFLDSTTKLCTKTCKTGEVMDYESRLCR
jgi:hypothetical protein